MSNSRDPIDTSNEEDDDGPTQEELEQIQLATLTDAEKVDALILQSCTSRWRKVAMVVGIAEKTFDKQFPHLPASYISIRIIEMERSGVLEVAGDAMNIRFSEVRIARPIAD